MYFHKKEKLNMAKKKYYVVWKGRETGIFETWAECTEQIHGFKQAQYKSFGSLQAAEDAFNQTYWEYVGKDTSKPEMSEEERKLYGEPIMESIAVDAAWNTASGDMEYKGVETKTGKEIFIQGPFKDGTNNVGEFLALVHGLAWLKRENLDLPIYTDSRTAMVWVRDKCANTSLEETERNAKLFDLISRAEKWLKENEYDIKILKWETKAWGEIPADFGRK